MQGTISRRSFITGAAMAGVAAATASAAVASVIDPSEEALAATAGSDQAGVLRSSIPQVPYKPAWLGDAPQISEDQITQTIEADIVVVGRPAATAAGPMCAFAAAENGAAVAVIESQPKERHLLLRPA